ncbi:hypothetical protein EMCRGX_G001639 [Ephydatia muelleri]
MYDGLEMESCWVLEDNYCMSLRKLIDLTLVDALLASQMAEDPFGPGVAPMAAVCISTKSVENLKMDHAL